jgi:mannose-1-phosphate guanylyltransferase
MTEKKAADLRRSAKGVYAVVLVGGRGKRLRPLSTDKRPKAFLSVTRNKKTMFRNTIDRIRRMVPDENIVVVANRLHTSLVTKDMPEIRKRNLLLEPVSRNTAPAVAFASKIIAERDKDAVVMVLPTDHYISDEAKQVACLEKSALFIKKRPGGIVVIGLKPRYPSTEFGYIKIRARGRQGCGFEKVERFVEKPDLDTAKRYMASGGYLWNSGVFIFRAGYFLKAVKRYAPGIFNILGEGDADALSYGRMPDISLDYAVMEKERRMYCVRAAYGWDDMGSFRALKNVLIRESRRFVEKDGKIVSIL